jgi:MATE family multidrug resistance protein
MSLKTYQRYLGEGRALLAIAWPMVIAQLAQMGTGVVDTIMAGRYSATDLAAIAIGYNIWLPLYLFTLGVMLAATAIIAQDFGAGRLQKIRDALPQSLWLAVTLGLIAGPLCFSTDPLLSLLSLDPTTHDKSLDYLQAVAFGLPATVIFQALRCHAQGIGILRPFAIASVIGFCANVPLNYAFIYGHWGIPEMGAAGCGWATAISMWLSPILIAFYTARAENLKPYLPPFRLVSPHWPTIAEILRLGFPIGLTFFLEIGVFSLIGLFIATLGNVAMAAHQIAYNIFDVLYMPLISIGSAMATRVGHAIGSSDRARVMLAVRCGTGMTMLMGLASMALLVSLPGLIVSAYTNDGDIHDLALTLIHLAAVFIVIDSAAVSATFCLRAFKDTRVPFLITCVVYWLFILPLGYWMGLMRAETMAEGTAAFWKALILGLLICSVLIVARLYQTLRRPLPPAGPETEPQPAPG